MIPKLWGDLTQPSYVERCADEMQKLVPALSRPEALSRSEALLEDAQAKLDPATLESISPEEAASRAVEDDSLPKGIT